MEKKKTTQPKLHIRKGDKVRVITGDDKGKEGVVLEVILEKNRAVVEGLNIVTKHEKPSAGKPEGGIKKVEASIHVSNLQLIDPASGKATRVGRKLNEKGKLQRYAKKTGELIK
ncbi:50S ribosomal protein L24 [Pseudochryseolinea flava]|uniref:Large ribosomal subunit protein uL24 n=1 Tax=Pseudochryseolinea flava TaxID=2059302 RepID=A0A364XY12_9BACT|nr:50S ribosomal protein L24 [Pseudochryseolinea flava]RAV99326.1 50S ribosomal protein L24 [Pseudochryseolinea flava]